MKPRVIGQIVPVKMALRSAVTPISSVMTPDGEGPLYDGPSMSPCDDEPGDEKKNNIEIDPSDLKNHPKANCVYDKLSNSGTFKGVISKFAGENTSFDLDIEVGDIPLYPDALGGATKKPNRNNKFRIIINKNHIDRPTLDIARTFLHEGIHVELSRKVASVGGLDSISAC